MLMLARLQLTVNCKLVPADLNKKPHRNEAKRLCMVSQMGDRWNTLSACLFALSKNLEELDL